MASLRGVRRRVCGRKIRYNSFAGAKRAAIEIRNKTGDSLEPYRCTFCGKGRWHLGHQPADIKREIAERRAGRPVTE